MNPQNDQTWNTALDGGIDLQNQKRTLTPEYDQALTEAQNQFKALSKTFSLFVGEHAAPDVIGFQCVIDDAEKMVEAARQLYLLTKKDKLLAPLKSAPVSQTPAAPKANGSFKINSPHRMSMADIIEQQNQERGLVPLPLEAELLLKRVKDGGHSGQFLADAFISAYRTGTPFPHSLGGLIKLDTEDFRLFHQVLHIRHISGWNDNYLYQIEQRIEAILEGERQLQAASMEGN